MIYESPATPMALARYLATYINDDSTIIAHVKHRFGVKFDKNDISKMRSSLPRKYMQGQGNPSKWDTKHDVDFRGARPSREDLLLSALLKHHRRIVDKLMASHVKKYGRKPR